MKDVSTSKTVSTQNYDSSPSDTVTLNSEQWNELMAWKEEYESTTIRPVSITTTTAGTSPSFIPISSYGPGLTMTGIKTYPVITQEDKKQFKKLKQQIKYRNKQLLQVKSGEELLNMMEIITDLHLTIIKLAGKYFD